MLSKKIKIAINNTFEDKINDENMLTIYNLTKVFNLQTFSKQALCYIGSCFTMLLETQNFLDLDYSILTRILGSNELHLTSELEVLNSANEWLNYNITERRKHAKDLLLKVRLPLLPEHTLRYILKESSTISVNEDCVAMLKDLLEKNENCIDRKSSFYYTHRYCSHSKFNFLVCGGRDIASKELAGNVNRIDGSNLKSVKTLPSLIQRRDTCKAVCLKGEVYVFGGYDDNVDLQTSIERYSIITNTWTKVADIYDGRQQFCVCAFMDKIIMFAGYTTIHDGTTDSCLQFDTKNHTWKQLSGMNEVKQYAACVVFEGRIVVSGGMCTSWNDLNTVESYDVIADEWSSMPNMINGHSLHELVVVKNKLFVIGRGVDECEVFDTNCKKFVSLKPQGTSFNYLNNVIAVGSKLFVLQNEKQLVWCYDVDKDNWLNKNIKYDIHCFACVKLPWF